MNRPRDVHLRITIQVNHVRLRGNVKLVLMSHELVFRHRFQTRLPEHEVNGRRRGDALIMIYLGLLIDDNRVNRTRENIILHQRDNFPITVRLPLQLARVRFVTNQMRDQAGPPLFNSHLGTKTVNDRVGLTSSDLLNVNRQERVKGRILHLLTNVEISQHRRVNNNSHKLVKVLYVVLMPIKQCTNNPIMTSDRRATTARRRDRHRCPDCTRCDVLFRSLPSSFRTAPTNQGTSGNIFAAIPFDTLVMSGSLGHDVAERVSPILVAALSQLLNGTPWSK